LWDGPVRERKIHDVIFVGMPKLEQDATLDRSSLTLGDKGHVFLPRDAAQPRAKDRHDQSGGGIGGRVQQLFQTLSANGITADDWKAAFGLELGSFRRLASQMRVGHG